ncbi:MAG: hypothetical protein KC493_17905 [Bacteriovoracaceae bacterium]|nr:hypothetical protein [Bacteriovoracaceae bacterium]
MELRQTLKSAITNLHELVEQNQLMKLYASGKCEHHTYQYCLEHIGNFWVNHTPEEHLLPKKFSIFLKGYIESINQDCSSFVRLSNQTHVYNEYAFFYVFLGSCLGASFVIKNYNNSDLPKKHLDYLVTGGLELWREFIPILNKVEHDQELILADSLRLFSNFADHFDTYEVSKAIASSRQIMD